LLGVVRKYIFSTLLRMSMSQIFVDGVVDMEEWEEESDEWAFLL
jgi:hypothetical protein